MEKKVTKKQIQSILRAEDPTAIYKLVHIINGGKVTSGQVYGFIHEYAPTARLIKKAWNIAHPNKEVNDYAIRNALEYQKRNGKEIAMQMLREEMGRPFDDYTKIPMLFDGWLWFTSPAYGKKDYNARRALLCEGNETFCQTLCRVGKRYIK